MEMVGRLSSSVIHDLNNLLTVIQLNSALIEGGGLDEAEIMGRATQIGQACRQSSQLTRKVLDLARRRSVEDRPVNVNALVNDLARLFEAFVAKKATVRVNVAEAPLWVWGSASDVEQMLMNLVLNAIDAMPEGGVITIGCQPAAGNGAAMVEITVRDEGCGIPVALRQRVLEPFFTTRENEGGTGMGLYIVDQIVQRMRGSLGFEAAPGAGTIVRICLPACAEEETPAQVNGTAPVPRETRTILLVEDDESIRNLTRFILTRAGYVVDAAETGEEAIELWSQRRREIDLVLSDLVLPGISGRDVVMTVLAQRPEVAVLYMSGFATAWDDESLFNEAHFIAKPFHPDALLAKVAAVLAERQIA
jgi:CheY-like chemotaxis protein